MLLLYRGGGFDANCGIVPHLAYSFAHANVWHYLCNMLVLWSIRGRMHVLAAYCVAVAASYLPMWGDGETVGMSGMLFAMFGLLWGETGLVWRSVKKAGPVLGVMMLLPGVNGVLHVYCFAAGFAAAFLKGKIEKDG